MADLAERLKKLFCATIFVGPLLPVTAQADEFLVYNQIIVKPQQMIENAHQLQKTVAWASRNAFDPGQTGFVSVSAFESGEDGEPAASTRWNVWVSGSYTNIDDSQPISGFDSDQAIGLAGIDYKLTDNFILGALVSGTWSDTSNTGSAFAGSASTDGWGAGVYGAAIIQNRFVFDASWLYNATSNSTFDGSDTANYDSTGWIAAANLTLYHYINNWRISPSVGINYSYNRDDAYTDSIGLIFPQQRQRTGVFEFGGQVGYTHQTQNATTMEFWAGLYGEWTFLRDVSPSFGTVTRIPTRGDDVDARLSAGMDVWVNDQVSVTFSGEIGGLAITDYLSASGTAKLAFSF